MKDPVPIVQEAEWAPGSVWTGGKSRLTGIRSPDRLARSRSLYRLSYRAHLNKLYIYKFTAISLPPPFFFWRRGNQVATFSQLQYFLLFLEISRCYSCCQAPFVHTEHYRAIDIARILKETLRNTFLAA